MKLVDVFTDNSDEIEMPFGTPMRVHDNPYYYNMEIYKSETIDGMAVILYNTSNDECMRCKTLMYPSISLRYGLTKKQLLNILKRLCIDKECVTIQHSCNHLYIEQYYKAQCMCINHDKYIEPTSIVTYGDQTFIITCDNLSRLVITNVDNGEYISYDIMCHGKKITYRHLQTWLWGKYVDKIEYHGTLNEWLDK